MHRRRLLASVFATALSGCLRLDESATPSPGSTPQAVATTTTGGAERTPLDTETSGSGESASTAKPRAELSISADWPQFQFDAANTGHHPTTTGPTGGVERAWTFEREGPVPETRSKSEEWSQFIPVVAGGTAYVSSQDDSVYAIDVATGKQLWRFTADTDVQDAGGRKCTPAVADGVVIAEGSGGHLYGLDAVTGESRWVFRRNIGADPVTPTVVDGMVYAENKGDVFAFEAETSSLHWIRNDLGSLVYQAVSGGGLYVPDQGHGSGTSRMIALDASNGEIRWTVEGPSIGGTVIGDALVTGRKTDGVDDHLDGPPTLYVLDVASGGIRWETELPSQPTTGGPPAVADGQIYLGLSDGNLYAYDLDDGSQRWAAVTTASFVTGNPTVADGHVYFGGPSAVYCYRAEDGARRWSYPLPSVAYSPTVLDEAVIVGTAAGAVHALRERD